MLQSYGIHTQQLRKKKLEQVQHKFLRFVARKCFNTNNDDVVYTEIEEKLKLDTLEMRRTFADVKFTIKSFNGSIDGQTYIDNLQISAPNANRGINVFRTITSKTDVGLFSVMNRLMTSYNQSCGSIEWLRIQPEDNTIKDAVRARSVHG